MSTAPFLGLINPRTGGMVKQWEGARSVSSTALVMVEKRKLFSVCVVCAIVDISFPGV